MYDKYLETVSSTTKRRLVVLVAVALLLLACGLWMFLLQLRMVRPIYPGSIPYGEVEQGCAEIVYCYSRAKFYTYDAPETVDKYFQDEGLELVAWGASGGRPSFLYTAIDGFIRFGPFTFNVESEIFLNYDDRGGDETTIEQSSTISLHFVK